MSLRAIAVASSVVTGPASSTDNAVARFDGTTGKIIQNSAVTIADDGATVIAANSASDGLRITQIGAGNALVVEDSANPDASPFVVDASGKVGIGSSPNSLAALTIGRTITGGTTAYGQLTSSTIQSDVTVNSVSFISNISTQATAFTAANVRHFQAANVTIGAGSAVTTQVGFNTGALSGATNNYAFQGGVAAAANSYNLYMSGTADNFLQGSLGIGSSSINASALLDVQSTTKGVRMPNMTTVQKNAIASPAAGLMIFDTTLAKLCVYSGAAWQTITSV
jgi:hypothetical protein